MTHLITSAGSNVMRSIHGVGELMTQVVLRGGGFLPSTPTAPPDGEVGKTQTEPEKEDILVMDTKLKIIEILQVTCWHPFTVYVDKCVDVHVKHLTWHFIYEDC